MNTRIWSGLLNVPLRFSFKRTAVRNVVGWQPFVLPLNLPQSSQQCHEISEWILGHRQWLSRTISTQHRISQCQSSLEIFSLAWPRFSQNFPAVWGLFYPIILISLSPFTDPTSASHPEVSLLFFLSSPFVIYWHFPNTPLAHRIPFWCLLLRDPKWTQSVSSKNHNCYINAG